MCTSEILCFFDRYNYQEEQEAQDGGDISGSAGSGSAEVPGTHVCGVLMCRKCVVMCKNCESFSCESFST